MSTIRTLLAIPAAVLGLFLALPIVVLGLPFWTIAFLTRFMANRLESQFLSWSELIEFDPLVGWRPKANLNAYYLSVHDDIFSTVTDSSGWPGKARLEESDVVVFGDSFAFGYGVNREECFAELNTRPCIKAIGAPGYNMVQELLLMQQFKLQLKGKFVVWFICLENDLYENLMPHMRGYRMPFVRRGHGNGGWKIVTEHLSPTKWFYSSPEWWRSFHEVFANLCGETFLAARAYSACEFLIQEGARVCSQVDAQLVILTIPHVSLLTRQGLEQLKAHCGREQTFNPDFPDQKISQICQKYNVPFLAAKQHLGALDYKEHDPHWNQRGHQRVAQLLIDLYIAFRSGALPMTVAQENISQAGDRLSVCST